MYKKPCMLALLFLLLIPAVSPAIAQEGIASARLLLVDESKTFASTLRVAGLAKTIRDFEGASLELTIRLADVHSSYDDPLEDAVPEAAFDLIIIVPRGIDDGSVRQIWILTTLASSPPNPLWEAVELLSLVVDAVFEGIAAAVDPMEDLWPAMLSAGYAAQGWLQ
ncbi:hypothetical protein JW848_04990 [Candidatus Bipolaricaulota bacterium]|nr:hypothetical protein [Candidatus Bipolaricaulota bacterium]